MHRSITRSKRKSIAQEEYISSNSKLKKPSLAQDSNPACSYRMLSLKCLCHHPCPNTKRLGSVDARADARQCLLRWPHFNLLIKPRYEKSLTWLLVLMFFHFPGSWLPLMHDCQQNINSLPHTLGLIMLLITGRERFLGRGRWTQVTQQVGSGSRQNMLL